MALPPPRRGLGRTQILWLKSSPGYVYQAGVIAAKSGARSAALSKHATYRRIVRAYPYRRTGHFACAQDLMDCSEKHRQECPRHLRGHTAPDSLLYFADSIQEAGA